MKRHLLLAALTAAACCVAPGGAWAELSLVESTWISESQTCAIREIKLYDFGHALVTADGLGTDEADWVANLSIVHVRFEHWNGTLDGTIEGDIEFKATYTWRSEETLSITSLPCAFRRK